MDANDFDVIVVGGGAAGLNAALVLDLLHDDLQRAVEARHRAAGVGAAAQ